MRSTAAGMAVLGILLGTASAQGNDGEAFKARLLAALASGSPRQVAALVKYPIRVRVGALPYPIPVDNAAAMVQMQNLFFTPEMRCAIEESRVARPGQPAPRHPMLVADGVVTLAGGRVIAERTPQGYRITRLDVIGHPDAPGNAKPKDVLYAYGEGEMVYSGRLGGDDVDGYLVSARAGSLLQVKIERFPGRSLRIRVTDEQSGMVLQGAQSEFSRLWAARVSSDGKYRVDIVRRAAFCDPSVTYLLTIGLRR
jgi:hypothetical protein